MQWHRSIACIFVIETKNRVQRSDNTVGGWKQVFKQRFTKLIKVCCIGIFDRIVQIVLCLFGVQFLAHFCVQFLELQVEFRHLLPQLGVPQLLEYVVSKDCNESYECYCDRGVPNCKLVSIYLVNIVSDTWIFLKPV